MAVTGQGFRNNLGNRQHRIRLGGGVTQTKLELVTTAHIFLNMSHKQYIMLHIYRS